MTQPRPTVVLFVSSNPTGTTPLAIKAEAKAIVTRLQTRKLSHAFTMPVAHGLKYVDLDAKLSAHDADIVHFSGHGTGQGELVVSDDQGQPVAMPPRAVADLFELLRGNIRCVVLNACYMAAQAAALQRHIDIVIGTTRAVNDRAAIQFAAKLYERLASGDSVQKAFDIARIIPELGNLGPADTPLLIAKPGINPLQYYLYPLVAPPARPAPRDESRNYIDRAAAIHESISLAGFETKVRVPIKLDELHVPLRAVVQPGGTEAFGGAKEAQEKMRGHETAREVTLAEAFECVRTYGKRRGIILLGDPGSGKTTQLKRLLLSVAREGATSIKLPDGIVPVFLALRNLSDPGADFETFIKQELRAAELRAPEGFAQRLLDEGRILFLFDGLDEIPALSDRGKVAARIDKLLRAYPDSWFVVTCRYAGYTGGARLSEEFLEMHLRPLDDEQAEQFIRNWFRIVEASLTADKEGAEIKAKEMATELITRLREPDSRSGRVAELTRNPLLLTTICLVHRDRGRLPHRRAELYDECVSVLLERWRYAKGAKVRIPGASARKVLQPVAHWMHGEDRRTLATKGELEPVIEPLLRNVEELPSSAGEFLDAIRDESGLLTGWSGERYGFMHLGFQEYLTARESLSRLIRDESAVRELAQHFGESWWQEVILLFLALQDAPFERFMRVVVDLPAFGRRSDFVDMCLGDALQKSPVPFLEILDRAPGRDSGHWACQLTALRVVERLWPEELKNRAAKLAKHPSAEIRAKFGVGASAETVVVEPSGYVLVRIPGGKFLMGSASVEYADERPEHEVSVPEFLIGRDPVTNEEWGRYLKANPKVKVPEYWGDRRLNQPAQPVVGILWKDSRAYCKWAGLRLPSEAEWEYACRAGTTTAYWSGDSEDDLARVGWYVKNAESRVHPVGEKPPNPFGLRDMHGNVFEWCEDAKHHNYEGAPTDGSAWTKGPSRFRVYRGGSWYCDVSGARSASRRCGAPEFRCDMLGVRPAKSVVRD